MRRPTLLQVRLITALIVGLYVTMHLLNHSLGLISVNAQEAARPWVMMLWHSWVGQVLLYGSLATHMALGLYSMARRRHFRIPRWELIQLILGLAIPYFLLSHIVNTRGTRILTRIDIDYVYEIANLWVAPANRYRQITLVLLVWVHFAVGLHFWLRIRAWYRKAYPTMLMFYVLVPLTALLGFAEVGMKMTTQARADPKWMPAMVKKGVPADPQRAKVRSTLRGWVGYSWLGVVGVVFAAAQMRNLFERGRRFTVTYSSRKSVRAPVGMTLLEVSRLCGMPHTSVCGGRARCTTCRVRVTECAGALPDPNTAESRALARIGSPPGLRLACQTRPRADVSIEPLIKSIGAGLSFVHRNTEVEFGQERHVTVLFLDVRGSATLAERRLPYDVVFLFNQLFGEMGAAVDSAGGHYSNYTGDGLMAIFGLQVFGQSSARAALQCAAGMLERLERFNRTLAQGFEAPIGLGIGVHTGLAIVGRMGPPRSPLLTALGDTVNTASRLQELSKDLGAPVIVSADSLGAAGVRVKVPLREVQVRGRHTMLRVACLDGHNLKRVLE
jgi:adenylate cyclase